MTDREINAAVAEDCGWTCIRPVHLRAIRETGLCGHPPNETHYAGVPDYCHDLNAMHEAERWLINREGDYFYAVALSETVKADTGSPFKGMALVCATARQRAEALLRTVEKWED